MQYRVISCSLTPENGVLHPEFGALAYRFFLKSAFLKYLGRFCGFGPDLGAIDPELGADPESGVL